MALKETIDIVAAFGYVAGTLTACGLLYKGWKVFGPSSVKKAFSPEVRELTKKNERGVKRIKSFVASLQRQHNTLN